MDDQELYCGHCHEFKTGRLYASDFEKALIAAVLSPPHLAPERMRRVVAGIDYLHPPLVREAAISVTRLGFARAITPAQRALLRYGADEIQKLSRSTRLLG